MQNTNKIEGITQPNPTKHLLASLAKSVTRIVGYLFLLPLGSCAQVAAFLLIVGELIGIVEELV